MVSTFHFIITFNPYNNPWRCKLIYPYFWNEKCKHYRKHVIYPQLARKWINQGWLNWTPGFQYPQPKGHFTKRENWPMTANQNDGVPKEWRVTYVWNILLCLCKTQTNAHTEGNDFNPLRADTAVPKSSGCHCMLQPWECILCLQERQRYSVPDEPHLKYCPVAGAIFKDFDETSPAEHRDGHSVNWPPIWHWTWAIHSQSKM